MGTDGAGYQTTGGRAPRRSDGAAVDAARRLTVAASLNADGVGCLDEGRQTSLETKRTARGAQRLNATRRSVGQGDDRGGGRRGCGVRSVSAHLGCAKC